MKKKCQLIKKTQKFNWKKIEFEFRDFFCGSWWDENPQVTDAVLFFFKSRFSQREKELREEMRKKYGYIKHKFLERAYEAGRKDKLQTLKKEK